MDDANTGGGGASQARFPKSKASEHEQQSSTPGPRGAVRTSTSFNCLIEGARGNFAGLIVDVSRTGALVRLVAPDFATDTEQEQLALYTARVWHYFEEGMVLSLVDQYLRIDADLVRVTGYDSGTDAFNLVGVQFRCELTCWECSRLDIVSAEDRSSQKPLAEEHLDDTRTATGT